MGGEASRRRESPATAEAEAPPDPDGTLIFRAVNALGKRRGIRLEAIFWRTITAMAASDGRTLGQQIGSVSVPEAGNLASTLRVQAAQWLHNRLLDFERTTAPESIFAIIHACPTPAFVLSADKKIVQYNQPFLNFIRTRLIGAESSDLLRTARLSLDTQLEQVIQLLRKNRNAPVVTGFVFGASEGRVRGQLKLVLAPTPVSTMVVAYITQL